MFKEKIEAFCNSLGLDTIGFTKCRKFEELREFYTYRKENNLENLVTFQRALLHINKIIPCDYWDFLKGNRKKFNGFYLSSYDWSLDTQNYLNSLIEY